MYFYYQESDVPLYEPLASALFKKNQFKYYFIEDF